MEGEYQMFSRDSDLTNTNISLSVHNGSISEIHDCHP